MNWQPIETAPRDVAPVLLAHFRDGQYIWVAMATWGTAMPGYTHCASYQGWFPEMPNLCDPTKGRKRVTSPLILGDVLGDDLPPTHWMPLPPPPATLSHLPHNPELSGMAHRLSLDLGQNLQSGLTLSPKDKLG